MTGNTCKKTQQQRPWTTVSAAFMLWEALNAEHTPPCNYNQNIWKAKRNMRKSISVIALTKIFGNTIVKSQSDGIKRLKKKMQIICEAWGLEDKEMPDTVTQCHMKNNWRRSFTIPWSSTEKITKSVLKAFRPSTSASCFLPVCQSNWPSQRSTEEVGGRLILLGLFVILTCSFRWLEGNGKAGGGARFFTSTHCSDYGFDPEGF